MAEADTLAQAPNQTYLRWSDWALLYKDSGGEYWVVNQDSELYAEGRYVYCHTFDATEADKEWSELPKEFYIPLKEA